MSFLTQIARRRPNGPPAIRSKIASQIRDIHARGVRKVTGRDVLLLNMPKHSVGAEIGVWRGDFSDILLKQLEPKQLYLVDPWPAPNVAGMYPHDSVADIDAAEAVYRAVASRFADEPRVSIVRATSRDGAASVPDRSLDWAYIDGLHYYEDVRDDLEAWAPKLKPGGVLCGDDYFWRDDKGKFSVKRAVDEWIARQRSSEWFTYRGQFFIREL
jgi:hypothetical protein